MIKTLFRGKHIGFYLYAATVVMALVSFICYLASANDSYGYDEKAIILYLVSIVVGVFFTLKVYSGIGHIVSALLYGAIFWSIVSGRVMYFMVSFSGIVPEPVSIVLMVALVLLLIMLLINIAASFFATERTEKNILKN